MNFKTNGAKLAGILLLVAVVLAGCNQSVSQAPAATAVAATPTGNFVTPQANVLSIETVKAFGIETAEAQTAIAAGGTPATPQVIVVTPGTGVTPQTGGTPGTPTNIIPTSTTGANVIFTNTPALVTPAGPIPTSGPKPASYTLQAGEFPYCIARRFNVNPDELLSLNGISDGSLFLPGLTLKIPQTGNPFPASRALHTHPDTYTVTSATETIYSVACYYGDSDPAAIAAANNLAVSAKLTAGQKLAIP